MRLCSEEKWTNKLSYTNFTNILKEKIRENALQYLLEKQGSKWKEIQYRYLLPSNNKIFVVEKLEMFAMKNQIVDIPPTHENKTYKCICDETENMKHIYNCKNIEREKSEYKLKQEKIYNGNIEQRIQVFQTFRKKHGKK